jgi:hypothetical protein
MTSKKEDYFSMSEAIDDVRYENDGKRKAIAVTKLFGKGLFNTAKYVIKEALPEHVSRLEKKKGKK